MHRARGIRPLAMTERSLCLELGKYSLSQILEGLRSFCLQYVLPISAGTKSSDLEVCILCLSKRGNTVRFSHDRSSSMRVQSLLRSCLTGVHSRQIDPLFAVTGIFKGKMTQQETGKTIVSFFAVSLHLVKISN